MVLFSEMFISNVLSIPVVDHLQDKLGRVEDIIVAIGEKFPKVIGFLVKCSNNEKQEVLLMTEIDMVGKQFVVCKSVTAHVVFTSLRDGEILLKRDILDKQIVDTEGVRVLRVNDLKLAKVDQEVRLIAVDIGLSGFLRRIGVLELFSFFYSLMGKRVPQKLIGWDHVEQLKTNIDKGKITIPHKRVEELHPADIAYIISQVHEKEKAAIFDALSEKTAAEALHELEPRLQAVLLMRLDKKKALSILEKMPADEIADVLGDLPVDSAEEYLRLLRVRKAGEVRKLLKHPDQTAGGLMTTEFVVLQENILIKEAIIQLRELAVNAEIVYYVYIINQQEQLVGVMSLRDIIIANPEEKIKEKMTTEIFSVPPEADPIGVADRISKYNLVAIPVVDKERKILGIVTVDDVMDFVLPPISRRHRHMLG